jgi:hypothetical protein
MSRKTVNELGVAVKLIQHPTRVLACGRSTMGKTTLCVDLILQQLMPKVKRCFAVCPTFWQQPALKRLRGIKGAFPKQHVFTVVRDNIFETIFRVLDRDHIPTLLYVDDAAAEASTNKGNKGAFSRLCLAAPHLNLSIVGCFQRPTMCSPAFRDNCECFISFISSRVQDVDLIIKELNPSPASPISKSIVSRALEHAWKNARFCFIFREAFTGRILYHVGFNEVITFNKR